MWLFEHEEARRNGGEHEERNGRMGLKVESSLPKETEYLIHAVIGAAIDVHRNLGPGFIESVYKTAMCHELTLRSIAFQCEKPILIPYKTINIGGQRLDLVVADQLILELKAVECLINVHEAQLLSYMKASRLRAGLLINFNVWQLKSGIKRVVL
jgi:GxxExxY protein